MPEYDSYKSSLVTFLTSSIVILLLKITIDRYSNS